VKKKAKAQLNATRVSRRAINIPATIVTTNEHSEAARNHENILYQTSEGWKSANKY
jgi:hypothetical protein